MGGGIAARDRVRRCAYYLFTGRYVSTDDSSVQAAQTTISANVPGRVIELDVHDNQTVHRGEVLFRLDDRPFRIAVEEAQAKLAAARMQIGAAKATYRHAARRRSRRRATRWPTSSTNSSASSTCCSRASARAHSSSRRSTRCELAQSQLTSAQQQVRQRTGAARRQSRICRSMQHPVVQAGAGGARSGQSRPVLYRRSARPTTASWPRSNSCRSATTSPRPRRYSAWSRAAMSGSRRTSRRTS